jgi:hypothetical protein
MLAATNADERRAVGSLMKLLNAVVAYDAGEPHEEVVAPDGLTGGDGESVIGIGAGQVVSRSILIRAMLKVSANDAARLLAIDIAGSERAYATMMNRIGRERGWSGMTRPQFDVLCSPRGALLVGSPTEVVDKILYEHELFGHERFLAQMSVGPIAHAKVMRSIELLGTEVVPAVRKALQSKL